MDDNDLACIDKYLNAIRDVARASGRRARITWEVLPDGSRFPEVVRITLATGVPEAEEVGANEETD